MKTLKTFTLAAVMLFGVAGVGEASITTTVIGSYPGECVAYVKSQVPAYKKYTNLITYASKTATHNTHTCKAGSVAIINAGYYGHVAVVESCDSSGSTQGIKIRESNWKGGKITRRESRKSTISQAQSELKIYGYFRP